MLYLSLPLTKGAIKNRSGSENRSELEISPTFLLMNSNEEMKQSGHLKLESLGYRLGFPGRLANPGLFPFPYSMEEIYLFFVSHMEHIKLFLGMLEK